MQLLCLSETLQRYCNETAAIGRDIQTIIFVPSQRFRFKVIRSCVHDSNLSRACAAMRALFYFNSPARARSLDLSISAEIISCQKHDIPRNYNNACDKASVRSRNATREKIHLYIRWLKYAGSLVYFSVTFQPAIHTHAIQSGIKSRLRASSRASRVADKFFRDCSLARAHA